jgi:hypothetical protein
MNRKKTSMQEGLNQGNDERGTAEEEETQKYNKEEKQRKKRNLGIFVVLLRKDLRGELERHIASWFGWFDFEFSASSSPYQL